jgi:hypothetical protein
MGGGWSTPRSGRFTSGKAPRYPLRGRLGGPQDRSERVLRKEHLVLPPGFAPRAFQTVVGRYPDPPYGLKEQQTTHADSYFLLHPGSKERISKKLFCAGEEQRVSARVKLGKNGHGKLPSACAISGLCRGVGEIFALRGCYTALIAR